MKKLFFALAWVAIIFATSCKKENVNEPVNPEEIPANAFLCEIDNGAMPQNAPRISDGMGTMTTTNGTDIFWKNGDKITVNGIVFTNSTGADKGKAYFTNSSFATTGYQKSPYYAFYPENIQKDLTQNLSNPQYINKGEFPSSITVDNNNNAAHLPMFAYRNTDHWLTFYNICAVLELKVPVNCTEIIIKSTDKLCGQFEVKNYTTSAPYAELINTATTGSNTIKLTGSFTTNSLVYIAIPAGTYHGVSFELGGTTDDGKIYVTATKNEMTVACNVIYPATLNATPKLDKTIPDDGFCFTALTANAGVSLVSVGNVSNLGCSFEYTTVIGTDTSGWTTYTVGTTGDITLTNVGDKVYFRAGTNGNKALASSQTYNYHKFTSTNNVSVSGDITYLLDQNKKTSLVNKSFSDGGNRYAFVYLFNGMNKLINASGLEILDNGSNMQPQYCYYGLFNGCSELTTVFASLPSQKLGGTDYAYMFNDCSKLTTAITIGATSLNSNCFQYMFQNCAKLSSVTLEATSSITGWTEAMFSDWLNGAGTDQSVTSKTIHVKNSTIEGWFNTHNTCKYGWTVSYPQPQ